MCTQCDGATSSLTSSLPLYLSQPPHKSIDKFKKNGFCQEPNLNWYNLPTTDKYPNCVFAVTVFIWHMYLPLSSSWTLVMCRYQVRCLSCLSCVTLMRGFRVITWLWTVRMADCSKCIHATYTLLLLLSS